MAPTTLMPLALVETSGDGNLRGVWAAHPTDGRPSAAFLKQAATLMASRMIDEAEPVITRTGGSWDDFLMHLFERQNLLTVQRIRTRTDLPASEFLEEVALLWSNWRTGS